VDRRELPHVLIASAAAVVAGLTRTSPATAQTIGNGRLLGPPFFLTGFSSGTYTPAPGTNAIYVLAIGAGGGAGGAAWNGTGSVTGGGGGGGVCASYFSPVDSDYVLACGTGGIGGQPGAPGVAGGNTRFDALVALGGRASPKAVDGVLVSAGANAGAISAGWNIVIAGAPGGLGFRSGVYAVAGSGGNSPLGTGGGGRPNNGAGLSASGFGAGGGGANALTSPQSGGSGSDGVIVIWEFS
jgi:hypothetical protein